ncbi:MAG: type 4a pilus biogenesis protein PilO [Deltaproteobacteria bacterium]|nr:type 4a pilus biogenesis protein PilO [Deltaproteobacteria bacterium]
MTYSMISFFGSLKTFKSVDSASLKLFRPEFIAVCIFIVSTFAFYRFVYRANAAEAIARDAKIVQLRADITRIQAEAASSEKMRVAVADASSDLAALEERLVNLKLRLPSEKQLSGILAEINANSGKKGVRIVSIKPQAVEDKGELARMPFHVVLECGFTSFGDYLDMIENLKRIIIVDNFLLENKDGASMALAAHIYLSAYVLKGGR